MSVTVMICVGPYTWYKRWLTECIDSARNQTLKPDEILLIDDMAGLNAEDYPDCRIWRSPWRLGIPAAPNCGIALAQSDLVFPLSCDDRLMPNCLRCCVAEWEAHHRDPLGYYWVDVEYSTGERQALPCGHALIPRTLWQHTGGNPPEAGVGACDHIFINMLMEHPEAGHLYHVPGGPLYWHREHDEQYTHNANVSPNTIAEIRQMFSQRWERIGHGWGRYEP